MCQGGLPRGRQPQPPALPALRFWADRGRPQAGLCHAPSAAALFAFKSPELGEGRAHSRENRTGSWLEIFVLGYSLQILHLCSRPLASGLVEIRLVGLVPSAGSPGCNPGVKNVRQSRGWGGTQPLTTIRGHPLMSRRIPLRPPQSISLPSTIPLPPRRGDSPEAWSRLVARSPLCGRVSVL